MDELCEKLMTVLETLQYESINCSKTESEIKNLQRKYNIMFLGSKFNTFYSNELFTVLGDKFKLQINADEFNESLPIACKLLHMKCEPFNKLSNMKEPTAYVYQVTLFE